MVFSDWLSSFRQLSPLESFIWLVGCWELFITWNTFFPAWNRTAPATHATQSIFITSDVFQHYILGASGKLIEMLFWPSVTSSAIDDIGFNLRPKFVSLCQHYLGNFPILSWTSRGAKYSPPRYCKHIRYCYLSNKYLALRAEPFF